MSKYNGSLLFGELKGADADTWERGVAVEALSGEPGVGSLGYLDR